MSIAVPGTDPASAETVVLQLGFDGVTAFLQDWEQWRGAMRPSPRLHHVVVLFEAPPASALRSAMAHSAGGELARQLAASWPPLTPGLHRLAFEDGQVQLLLAVGPKRRWLAQLLLRADSLHAGELHRLIDHPRQLQPLARALARLCKPGARLRCTPAEPAVARALVSAGFELSAGAEGEVLSAHYAPRFAPRSPSPPARSSGEPRRDALVVGAGLAGCATAWALAELGWRVVLIERQAAPAQEASGNPSGMFCGIVHLSDGAHARLYRAAALAAALAVRFAIDHHGTLGQIDGALRLDSSGRTVSEMQQLLHRMALPADYLRALDARQASALCGIEVRHPAWFFAGGGWVQPGGLARSMLLRAGAAATLVTGRAVQAISRTAGIWEAHDAAGSVIAAAPTLILANAGDAMRLLQPFGAGAWPVHTVRGQLSLYRSDAATGTSHSPRLPLGGGGYWLPAVDGLSAFGATAQVGDFDGGVRAADHAHNLQRLRMLAPSAALPAAADLQGRVAWRSVASDRLPLVGAVPDPERPACASQRLQQQPRLPGLHVVSALGSRGVGFAVLGGQVLAAMISSAPVPLESDLVDALDPARFALREARRR